MREAITHIDLACKASRTPSRTASTDHFIYIYIYIYPKNLSLTQSSELNKTTDYQYPRISKITHKNTEKNITTMEIKYQFIALLSPLELLGPTLNGVAGNHLSLFSHFL